MSNQAKDALRRHRFTVGQFQRMGESGILRADARVELIQGEIIDMTPPGSRHAGTVNLLANLLQGTCGAAAVVAVQNPLILDDHSQPQPDLALLRPRRDFYRTAHPGPADALLVIEVSDASLRYDRTVKAPLYARHGIPELWLIDLDGNRLLRYREPSAAGYRARAIVPRLEAVEIAALPRLLLDLSALFDD